MISVLHKLVVLLALLVGSFMAPLAHAADVIDLAGRTISVPKKVNRILLGEGRFIPALAMLDREQPFDRIVGMLGEYERLDPAGYAQYRDKFPQLDSITRIGRSSADSFSVEKALALAPDLAIFSLEGHGPTPSSAEVITRLEKAGVTVAFIDFRQEPLLNTPKSIALLGALLGREAAAREYNNFYTSELARVSDASKRARNTASTSAFIDNHAGISDSCCDTMGKGMMGRYIEAAGGRNIAAAMIPGSHGTLSLEYLLTHQPDVYIGTAIGQADSIEKTPKRIVLGAGVSPTVAHTSLQRAVQRAGISELEAVKKQRVFAIWHHFYNSPMNVVAVQVFAKWLDPKTHASLDPDATLKTLYQRFQPIPLNGTYWTQLP